MAALFTYNFLHGHLPDPDDFISKEIQDEYGYPYKPSISIHQENGQFMFMGMAHYNGEKDFEKWGEVISF